MLRRFEAEDGGVVPDSVSEARRIVAFVPDPDESQATGFMIGGHDHQRVVGRIDIAVRPFRKLERDRYGPIELDDVPDRSFAIRGMRRLSIDAPSIISYNPRGECAESDPIASFARSSSIGVSRYASFRERASSALYFPAPTLSNATGRWDG